MNLSGDEVLDAATDEGRGGEVKIPRYPGEQDRVVMREAHRQVDRSFQCAHWLGCHVVG